MTESTAPSGSSHLLAASLAAGGQPCVLKHADTFGVFDQYGDITAGGLGEEGLYHEGTRFLSAFTVELDGVRPFFLDSAVSSDNDLLAITLTNPDLATAAGVKLPLATIHLALTRFLWGGVMYQEARITNHGRVAVDLGVAWHFAADYTDIFDVRGPRRSVRGRDLEPIVDAHGVILGYEGRDGVRRLTRLAFDPPPSTTSPSTVRYSLALEPHQLVILRCSVACQSGTDAPTPLAFAAARTATRADGARRRHGQCRIETSHIQMNRWIARATADLRTLTTDLSTGPYPYAGIPWFNTVFGRDGLIAAWQCLWLQPALARGVLACLARLQAAETIPERDAQPGRILHEMRRGELAALGEIPYGRYYGSVDATPLFVALAGAYYERTGDRAFIQSIRPSIGAALTWIDRDGDRDGDGFVEYERLSDAGLLHQGWKDADDALVHQNGAPAVGPIALCEVQGYVYAAWRAAARLSRALGDDEDARRWEARAADLRGRFNDAFWCEELDTYALALDGGKAPCRVRTSNAGQCLFGRIVEPVRAPRVAATLLGPDCFSGWGIRTLARGEAAFNPMGYHTGGVWPHDNALIAEGLASYGLTREASTILQALFEASLHFDLQRMPELFCGFARQPGEAPVPYPLACAPQAWAAGAVPLLLKASLGLHVDGLQRRVTFANPHLPDWLDAVSIFDLDVAGATIDLAVARHGERLSVSLLRGDGSVHVALR